MTIIVPSLPGFGFSGAPSKPYGPRKIAEVLNKMMTINLKYKTQNSLIWRTWDIKTDRKKDFPSCQ